MNLTAPLRVPKAIIRMKSGGMSAPPDDPRERAQLIADILQSSFGDDADDLVDELEDGSERKGLPWYCVKAWTEVDHPRGPGGKFIAKNSPAALKAAHAQVKETLSQPKTPQSLKKLTEHLALLTVKQLHELKKAHGLKTGVKAKKELVAKIAAKLHYGPGEGQETDDEAPSAAPKAKFPEKPDLPAKKPINPFPADKQGFIPFKPGVPKKTDKPILDDFALRGVPFSVQDEQMRAMLGKGIIEAAKMHLDAGTYLNGDPLKEQDKKRLERHLAYMQEESKKEGWDAPGTVPLPRPAPQTDADRQRRAEQLKVARSRVPLTPFAPTPAAVKPKAAAPGVGPQTAAAESPPNPAVHHPVSTAFLESALRTGFDARGLRIPQAERAKMQALLDTQRAIDAAAQPGAKPGKTNTPADLAAHLNGLREQRMKHLRAVVAAAGNADLIVAHSDQAHKGSSADKRAYAREELTRLEQRPLHTAESVAGDRDERRKVKYTPFPAPKATVRLKQAPAGGMSRKDAAVLARRGLPIPKDVLAKYPDIKRQKTA